jgi:hypothetical protein
MTPQQQAHARLVAAELEALSAEVLREVADLLAATPDEQLFGDTEFAVRQRVLKLVAASFSTHLAQKKTAMSAPASTVPTVSGPPNFRAFATAIR